MAPSSSARGRKIRAVPADTAIALAAAAVVLGWQQPAAGQRTPLSIERALEMARAASEPVAIARAGVQRAEAEEMRAVSERLPQVGAYAAYDRTLRSEFEGLFETPDGSGGMDGVSDVLPFGQKNIYRFGVSVSQPLFTGGRLTARNDMARAGRVSARLDLVTTSAQAILDVAQAYYDAVLSDRLVAIAEATLEQADAILGHTRLGRQVGTVPEFDLLQAEVSRDRWRAVVVRRKTERLLAYERVRQLLDLPRAAEIVLTTGLEEKDRAPATIAPIARRLVSAPEAADGGRRAIVQQAEQTVRIAEAAARIARSQYFPSVSIGTEYGRPAYPSSVWPAWDDFRTNWTVGVAVRVPLFTGGRITGDVLAAKADLAQTRAGLQLTEELAHLDELATREQLRASRAEWEARRSSVAQAQRAYEIADLRYREGVSTQVELADARLSLVEAQASQAQAARDVQVAELRLALLPVLPLPASFAASASALAAAGASPARAASGDIQAERPAAVRPAGAAVVPGPVQIGSPVAPSR